MRAACSSGKRVFEGSSQVRRAHAHAGYRVRPYLCAECGGWHATNPEKAMARDVRAERRA